MILIFADAHAQRGIWANLPIFGDAAFALQQIPELVRRHQVQAVFGLGDLADTQVNRAGPPGQLYQLVNALDVPLYFLQGQHDRDDPPWLAATAAVHLHGRSVCIGGRYFYGLDYQHADQLPAALATIPPGTDALLAHQVWAEWMGSVARPQGRLDDVPVVRAIWTGDLHDYRLTKLSGKRLALSPGSTCRQAIDEPDAHWVVLYDPLRPVDDPKAYQRLRLAERPILRFNDPILTEEHADQLVAGLPELLRGLTATTAALPEALRAPLVRCSYAAELGDLPERLQAVAAAGGWVIHLFAKPLSTRAAPAVLAAAPATVADALPEVLDRATAPEAFALSERLIAAGEDYEAALAGWAQEYLEHAAASESA